jgi:hypothetical protein
MLLRDSHNSSYVPIPLFAFFASRTRQSMLEILSKIHEMAPLDFIKEHLLRAFARHWVALAVRSGIVTEPHAQNLQLEVDLMGKITGRFIHRDMEDVSVDLNFRRASNLSIPGDLPQKHGLNKDYGIASHNKWLRMSLYNFFEGGVLYPLEGHLAQLQNTGKGLARLRKEFRSDLIAALREFDVKLPRRSSFDYDKMDSLVRRARNAMVAKA